MRTIKQHIKFFILLLVFASSKNFANSDHENEALYRLLHELRYLSSIVEMARNSAVEDSALRFDYDALERELAAVEKGISDYLHSERRDPRTLDAIHGAYTHGR